MLWPSRKEIASSYKEGELPQIAQNAESGSAFSM